MQINMDTTFSVLCSSSLHNVQSSNSYWANSWMLWDAATAAVLCGRKSCLGIQLGKWLFLDCLITGQLEGVQLLFSPPQLSALRLLWFHHVLGFSRQSWWLPHHPPSMSGVYRSASADAGLNAHRYCLTPSLRCFACLWRSGSSTGGWWSLVGSWVARTAMQLVWEVDVVHHPRRNWGAGCWGPPLCPGPLLVALSRSDSCCQ